MRLLLVLFGVCQIALGFGVDCPSTKELRNRRILVAFSGGPDAASLATRLSREGALPIPVYISYRFNEGGKTAKDLRFSERVVQLLGLAPLRSLRRPLESREKSERNRFLLEQLAGLTDEYQTDLVALGTFEEVGELGGDWVEESNRDISRGVLASHAESLGLRLVTWDCFGVQKKADTLAGLSDDARAAIQATTSCQMWWQIECGNCYSCLERHAAFTEAFGCDPTSYRPRSHLGTEGLPSQNKARKSSDGTSKRPRSVTNSKARKR